jgi:hypothetical protein
MIIEKSNKKALNLATNLFRKPFLVIVFLLIALGLSLVIISCTQTGFVQEKGIPTMSPGITLSPITANTPTRVSRLSEADIQKLAKQKASEFFDREVTVEEISIPFLAKFFSEHKTYRIRGYSGGYPFPSTRVLAVGRDGAIFLLPGDFNQVVRRENIRVENDATALALVKGFIVIRDNEKTKATTLFLESSSDIPWDHHPDDAKNPSKFGDVIRPPTVVLKEETYHVEIWTWSQISGGELNRWTFRVEKNGELTAQKETVANHVGDYSPFELR